MNNMSNAAAAIPPEVAAWCDNYAGFALTLAQAFLILALLVALVETALGLWAKWQAARKAPVVVENAGKATLTGAETVKLLELLKGILETLKGLPAWIAIFLAGLALLWMAGQKPACCASPCSPGPGTTVNPTTANGANPARPSGQVSNSQAPAAANTVR